MYDPAHPQQAAALLSSSSAGGAGGNGGNAAPSVVTLKNQFRQRLREEKAKALEGGGEKRIKKQVGGSWVCVWVWVCGRVPGGTTGIGLRLAGFIINVPSSHAHICMDSTRRAS